MAIITGSPLGNLDTQEEIYLEGAPYIYFQDYNANPLYNPDADGFYWNLSGTTTYPVFEIGCPVDVSFTENLTVNDVLCDHVGTKSTIQQRNYVEFAYSLQSFFPFQALRFMLKMGAVTETSPTQKMGIGAVNNAQYFHVYAPKVYDTDAADYIWMYFHKCQFVDPATINMSFGTPWQAQGLKLRAFADTSKPDAQRFGMFGRSDLSVIP